MVSLHNTQSSTIKGIHWAARITSILPGAVIILASFGLVIYPFITEGLGPNWWLLAHGLIWCSLLLVIAGIAWRWPAIGGTLSVMLSAFMIYGLLVGYSDFDTALFLPLWLVFSISGLLHLIACWGGRHVSSVS